MLVGQTQQFRALSMIDLDVHNSKLYIANESLYVFEYIEDACIVGNAGSSTLIFMHSNLVSADNQLCKQLQCRVVQNMRGTKL